MDRLRRKQRYLFILYLILNTGFIALIVFAALTDWGSDGKLGAITGLLACMLGIAVWFRPRLFYYAQMYGFARLRETAAPALPMRSDPVSAVYVTHLKSLGFHIFLDSREYLALHRISKDPTNLLAKSQMLDVIVVIRDGNVGYNDVRISQTINALENDYTAKKIHYRNYAIIQVKSGDSLDETTKNAVDQVTFDKQGGHGIAAINAYYDVDDGKVYFLHSDTYAPTAFYWYAVAMFKSTL